MSTLAITGGTGFVGGHLIERALAGGHVVRALARRPQPPRAGVSWIVGDLTRADALAAMVAGADVAIHVAGLTNAPTRDAFAACNEDGTVAMLAAATAAGVARFVQVSSLAAREPALSDYGWSKAQGDAAVTASDRRWTIVRPPAVFGPGDREMLELFRLARRGIVPLPPAGNRLSVIAVEDLAALLLTLATGDALVGAIVEPDDGIPGGWDARGFSRAIGAAVGRRVLPVSLPAWMLRGVSAVDRRLRGRGAKLTADRVRYFCHADWTSHAPPPPEVWGPALATPDALAATARWYRAQGLL